MKEFISLIAIGVYLTLSNYCLAYSIVTGEAHDPYKNVASQEKELPSHPACRGHEETTSSEKSSHDHHGKNESDTCCVKFVKCLESTLPQTVSISAPKFNLENILTPVPQTLLDLHVSKTWLTNHGPPGVTVSQGLLSSSSSRAPPYPLSL